MNTFILPSLSRAINAYLSLDTESKPRLKSLRGKIVTIELLPFHFTFHCVFSETDVHVQSGDNLEADTRISGTPLQMLGVMVAKDNRQRFFADDLIMEGNAEVGQQMIALFDELQIDWEEHVSRRLGDVPAYHLGRLARGIRGWLQSADDSLTQNINEFVHEEKQWLPTREALQDFFNDIDTLRMDADRIEAKMAQLCADLNEDEDTQ